MSDHAGYVPQPRTGYQHADAGNAVVSEKASALHTLQSMLDVFSDELDRLEAAIGSVLRSQPNGPDYPVDPADTHIEQLLATLASRLTRLADIRTRVVL